MSDPFPSPKDRIIVPLDLSDMGEAIEIIERLAPYVGAFKVGYELGYRIGWEQAADLVHGSGAKLFIDAKLNDISNTVGAGARALAFRRPDMLTVHASSGKESVAAAKEACPGTMILAVTVLTHLSDESSKRIFGAVAAEKVPQLALEAAEGGAHGIVCSPRELEALGAVKALDKLVRVTPGVRPSWADANDQKRVMTPAQAIAAGADFLVIGRPILRPPPSIGDPVRAAQEIAQEIAKELGK